MITEKTLRKMATLGKTMLKAAAILALAATMGGSSALRGQVLTTVAQNGTFYSNAIIAQDAPDPSCMKADDGFYYLYATGSRINIWRSKNMVNWSRIGTAFTDQERPTFVKGVNSYWAPDINRIGDKYVLYFAMSKWGGIDSCGVGVAVADKPMGPFKPVGGDGKLFTSYEIGVTNSIDPFYIEDDGHKYLFWGSFHGIYGIELSDDGLSIKEGANKVKIAGSAYEGAYIYKKDGYYYFFGSTGSCCSGANSTYQTVIARSSKLFGPYLNKAGETLLNNKHEVLIKGNDFWAGTGHNAELIEDNDGTTWIPYHAYKKSAPGVGRMVLLDRVDWKNGWPVVKDTSPSNQSAKPNL